MMVTASGWASRICPPAMLIVEFCGSPRSPFGLLAMLVHSETQPAHALPAVPTISAAATKTVCSIAVRNVPLMPALPFSETAVGVYWWVVKVSICTPISFQCAGRTDQRLGAVRLLAPHVDVHARAPAFRRAGLNAAVRAD